MSCEKDSSKFAHMAGQVGAGIAQLAGKRSFYAGLALGVGGMVSGLALVKAIGTWRRNKLNNGQRQPVPVAPVPGTPTNPRPISQETLRRPGTRVNPRKIPILSRTPTETKLQAATIRIRTGNGQPFTPQNSYRVVRPDGGDTGLAITPYVREDETGQLVEDDQNWGLTHAVSGSLISGPHNSISQAQELAGQLAELPWAEARLPAEAVNQARQIISAYPSNGEKAGEL